MGRRPEWNRTVGINNIFVNFDYRALRARIIKQKYESLSWTLSLPLFSPWKKCKWTQHVHAKTCCRLGASVQTDVDRCSGHLHANSASNHYENRIIPTIAGIGPDFDRRWWIRIINTPFSSTPLMQFMCHDIERIFIAISSDIWSAYHWAIYITTIYLEWDLNRPFPHPTSLDHSNSLCLSLWVKLCFRSRWWQKKVLKTYPAIMKSPWNVCLMFPFAGALEIFLEMALNVELYISWPNLLRPWA